MAKCEHDRVRQSCSVCSPEQVYRQYEYKARKRNLSFSLTLAEFEKLTRAECFYCSEIPAMGIDRRDNRIGYNSRNSVPACVECNFMKRAMLEHRFIARALKIAAHQKKKQEALRKETAHTPTLSDPPQAVVV
jgi:hypothetical protein